MARRWLNGAGLATVLLALLLQGCARPARTADAELPLESSDDGSRCEHEGKDLESLETRSSAARVPNVRRVFRLSSNKATNQLSSKREGQPVLVCREVDTNLDGRKDVFREFDNRGQPTRESADSNYDGRLDTWLSFSGGQLRKLELDRDGDGNADETRFYNQGVLSKIQRDTDRDSKPDRWEAYDQGRLTRIGMDLDADGVVDRWLQGEATGESSRESGGATGLTSSAGGSTGASAQ
jgi:hypothetical protein